MLEAKFTDSDVFSKILKLPNDLVKQIKIIALNEKFISKKKDDKSPLVIFYIVALDDNRTSFVSIELAKEDFETWKCDAPKSTEIKQTIENEDGSTTEFFIPPHHEFILNMEKFTKILSRKNAKEELTLLYDPEKSKDLILDMKKKDSKKGHRLFSAALEKDFEHEDLSPDAVKSVKLTNSCKLNYKTIDGAVKDAEIFNSIINVSTKGSDLLFHAESFTGSSECIVEDEDIAEKNFTRDTTIPFEIEFIKNILKGGDIDPMVKISFGASEADFSPILAEYTYKNSSITYLAAPRVEEEEEFDEDYYEEEIASEPDDEPAPKEKPSKKTTKNVKESKVPKASKATKASKKTKVEEEVDEEIDDDDIDVEDFDEESFDDVDEEFDDIDDEIE